MPKLGMEPIRRNALVHATIDEIGRARSLDVTVSQIAKRAGMSSALAHHYFGGKNQIFNAAMRHILKQYSEQVRSQLADETTAYGRLRAIIRASFGADNFSSEVISAWMNFYVKSQTDQGARRLLNIYQRRLHSNLMHDLRPLLGMKQANTAASTIGAMIDGLYIRHALRNQIPDGKAAEQQVISYLDQILDRK